MFFCLETKEPKVQDETPTSIFFSREKADAAVRRKIAVHTVSSDQPHYYQGMREVLV
jgi:hypothetical protein